jgi:hypothetical protein
MREGYSMVYRIRYRRQRGRGEGELVVEANSPNEAMVKFCHVHSGHAKEGRAGEVVTSVTPEDSGAHPAWS